MGGKNNTDRMGDNDLNIKDIGRKSRRRVTLIKIQN